MARNLGIDENTGGFVITDIQDGSLAAAKGFSVGDVIEQINGRPFAKIDELKAALTDLEESGRAVRLVIRRGGSRALAVIVAQDIAE